MVQPIDSLLAFRFSQKDCGSLEQKILLHPRGIDAWELILRSAATMQKYELSERELSIWAEKQPQQLQDYIQQRKVIYQRRDFRFCGLTKNSPFIMGIVNVTPDSFSDGGDFLLPDTAIRKGLALMGEGADIIDVGGESTKPGAIEVSPEEEMRRILPVIEGLASVGALVSVDTRHGQTMEAAIKAGAKIVNDISALTDDADALNIIQKYEDVSIILMHKQGQPKTMQNEYHYHHVVLDVYDYLLKRVQICEQAGIERSRLSVDAGIGFGKSVQHNLDLMGRLSLFKSLGCSVTLGASRKSFIAAVSRDVPPKERLCGSLAAALWAVSQKVGILRVHDVGETKQALDVWLSIQNAGY
ncbi:MAG: dihydropteroate synthase [Alphaproteobacteria bacterium]